MIIELFYFCVGAFVALVFVRRREQILIKAYRHYKNMGESAFQEALAVNKKLDILLTHSSAESKKPLAQPSLKKGKKLMVKLDCNDGPTKAIIKGDK